MDYREMFQVKPGASKILKGIDPNFSAGHDQQSAEKKIKKHNQRLRELQYHLYSEGKSSLLVVLQGLDSAGKDGSIKHVLGAMDPLGTRVWAFKVPSAEEAAHDFLWRVERQAPGRGEVVIFNRSHYEDVLVVRVHQLVTERTWSARYDLINNFEKGLVEHGTRILKFYLHISPEEQLERFKQRLDDPLRQWKISEADYSERELWPAYTQAYEEALSRTSTGIAPWYVIPSNHKWFRNLAISKIVLEELESLGMKLPEPQVDLKEIRRKYHQAEHEKRPGAK
jgi:PPK2 family polyphosphate:nucleotide phosphotransferase